jgi:anti-anti-sigma factor
MKISARREAGILVADVSGRLDLSTSVGAYDALVNLVKDQPHNLIVNLGRLEYISSAGLRVILRLGKFMEASGGQLRICQASHFVEDVIKASGFDGLIHLYADEKSAIADMN